MNRSGNGRRCSGIRGQGDYGPGDTGNWDILKSGGVELDAHAGEHGLGGEDGQAAEVGHDESVSVDVIGCRNKQVDAGTLDSLSLGLRVLCQDGAGIGCGPGKLGGGAFFEAGVAEIESRDSFLESDDVGDFDFLRAEAVGDADVPVATDDGVGSGRLSEDVPGGNLGRVVVVVDLEIEAQAGGLAASLGDGHAAKVRNAHLGAVDGELHRQHRRAEGD